MSDACVTDSFARAKEAWSGLIRSPYPMGAQAAGRIHPLKVCVTAAAVVNPGCALTDFNAEEAEYAMAVQISAAVQRLQGSLANAESRPGTTGPITLEVKQTGERSAGNPHAAFDVAGAGNVARSR